eukprot:2836189-Prymnesium_polylepis.2
MIVSSVCCAPPVWSAFSACLSRAQTAQTSQVAEERCESDRSRPRSVTAVPLQRVTPGGPEPLPLGAVPLSLLPVAVVVLLVPVGLKVDGRDPDVARCRQASHLDTALHARRDLDLFGLAVLLHSIRRADVLHVLPLVTSRARL